jgi:hypothetical protein
MGGLSRRQVRDGGDHGDDWDSEDEAHLGTISG